jgi:hypothetical protein
MVWIAIDRDLGTVYEGGMGYGRELVPAPKTAPAAIATEADESPALPASYGLEAITLLFREDSFDAVTRVRRGRFYTVAALRPDRWIVSASAGGREERTLYPFQSLHVPTRLNEIAKAGDRPLVAIGNDASFTIWTIVSVEGTSTGEFLVTLRGRQTYGALPDLSRTAIPTVCQPPVLEALTKLGDEIFRAGPGSVVDRARDAVSAVLSGYLQNLNVVGPGKELNVLIEKLENLEQPHKKHLVAPAAEIVRILHSREKPSVRERLPVSPVREQEAELAVYCVGVLLVELGWAKWR